MWPDFALCEWEVQFCAESVWCEVASVHSMNYPVPRWFNSEWKGHWLLVQQIDGAYWLLDRDESNKDLALECFDFSFWLFPLKAERKTHVCGLVAWLKSGLDRICNTIRDSIMVFDYLQQSNSPVFGLECQVTSRLSAASGCQLPYNLKLINFLQTAFLEWIDFAYALAKVHFLGTNRHLIGEVDVKGCGNPSKFSMPSWTKFISATDIKCCCWWTQNILFCAFCVHYITSC